MFNELQSKLTLKTTQLLTNNPSVGIRTRKHQNQLLSNRLNHAIKEQLTTKKYLLSHCSQTLNSLSPLATLNRGYALITGVETGELISSIKNLTIGDRINTRFSQGQIVSQIKEIKS
jgi:exodeoxyribonuclease VII large subunit